MAQMRAGHRRGVNMASDQELHSGERVHGGIGFYDQVQKDSGLFAE